MVLSIPRSLILYSNPSLELSSLADVVQYSERSQIIFLWNRRGEPLLVIYYKVKRNKQSTVTSSGNKKGQEKNMSYYTRSSNHWDILSLWRGFALKITRANSFLKKVRQFPGEGCTPLKMKSFLCIHRLQQNVIIISMKKGMLSCSLISSKSRKVSASIRMIFSLIQQDCAKGQWKNRWFRDSSISKLQQTQA